MTKPKVTDATKTERMAGLLSARFDPSRYCTMWQVCPNTGFNYRTRTRYADLLVMQLWPSDGLELHGFEIKASRTDLKRELEDPSKAEALAKYCHRWTLVTWNEAVVGTQELPEGWGWWSVNPEGDDFIVHRHARERPSIEEWPREFTASLVRRAATESPNATFAAIAADAALLPLRRRMHKAVTDAIKAAHQLGWARGRGLEAGMPREWQAGATALWLEWRKAFEADQEQLRYHTLEVG